MKVKTSELTGAALDWAVAKCESTPVARHSTGAIYLIDTHWKDKSRVKWLAEYSPSKHWAQGGPIIEREGISIIFHEQGHWTASNLHGTVCGEGPTPLVAAMRCYVTSNLGEEIEISEGLI